MGPVYDELGLLQVHWERVLFFFTDECGVPPHHPASRFGLAEDHLFSNPRIELHQVQRIEGESSDQAEAAERYADLLPDRLDVCLLALESDGALAGWFPGQVAALAREERDAIAVEAPKKPRRRVTLTPHAVARAREVFVVASGFDRRDAAARALAPGAAGEPASLLPAHATWFLDAAAAGSDSR